MLSPLHNAWYTAALQKCPRWPQRAPKREKETQGPGARPKHPEVCSVWWKTIAPTQPHPSSSCNVQDKHIKRCTRRIKKGRKRHNVVSELERGISNRNKGRNRRFSRRLIPAPSSPSKVPMSTKGKEIESWEVSPTPASLHWCELRQVKVTLGNIALKSLWNRSSYSASQELSKRRKGQDWRIGRCSQEWDSSGVWPRGHFMGFQKEKQVSRAFARVALSLHGSPHPLLGARNKAGRQHPSLIGDEKLEPRSTGTEPTVSHMSETECWQGACANIQQLREASKQTSRRTAKTELDSCEENINQEMELPQGLHGT